MEIRRGNELVETVSNFKIEDLKAVKIGEKDLPFVFRGEEVMYPLPIMSGLQLWYDFSGMTNNDATKDIAKDLSGNGNHGTLQNFNFTPESGYDKNKLLFDGVDDFLQIPENGLNPESMSVVNNGRIYSYEHGTVTTVNNVGELGESNINLFSPLNRTTGYFDLNLLELGETYTISSNSDIYRVKISPRTGSIMADSALFVGDVKECSFILSQEMLDIGKLHLVYNSSGNYYSEKDYCQMELKLEKSPFKTSYVPSSKDYFDVNYKTSYMQDLLLYNRPLTPEEIAYNYAIEKERFGIE